MAGWRDAITQEAQDDLDDLTDAAVDFAVRQLDQRGGFVPFTLAVTIGGDKQIIAPNVSDDVELEAAEQVAAQWDAIEEVKHTLRAVAVAVDVRLESGRDGIELTVEHREGIAIGLVFPYLRDGDGDHEVQAPSAHAAPRKVWPAAGPEVRSR